ncbi:polyprenyl synthetase family protein [Streptomyces sp. ET3-23]|uniref:polyprenyl synthetase family protein n=1 Tax=Streptomyces sp. ET3-23 TaxID=2885643 RepID=UPI001D10C89D|nr:polyprenyl synthetase family protein [Streptomyces sp. ET3-23]MCC2277729.1 polyprenyl synthetase family protein [Streptomyces sp. ET3-23]
MAMLTTSETLDPARIRRAVETVLEDFLAERIRSADSPQIVDLVGVLRGLLFAGGKLIRPAMCICGWHAAGGKGDAGPVVRVAASLELFHAFALIHDDVMDGSETRRGRPSAQRALAALHRDRELPGNSDRFGTNAAILLGDLALCWSDDIFLTAGLTPAQVQVARPVLQDMRTEIMLGQYLDLLHTGRLGGGVRAIDEALTAIRFKTAKYTFERPLQLGAALAGSSRSITDACSAYALPIGEAFQLRDDLLGVFGDCATTGKPTIDDLRDGKHTVLMSLAALRAAPSQLRVLKTCVGSPTLDEDQAGAVRVVLEETRARQDVERMIARRRHEALEALDRAPFPPAVRAALRGFAYSATSRMA